MLKSHKSIIGVIYIIMKTICPPGYHGNGFVATHGLGHMMYGWYIVFMIVYIYIIYIYEKKQHIIY